MPPQIQKHIQNPLLAAVAGLVMMILGAILATPQVQGMFDSVPDETALQEAEGTLTSFHQFSNAEGLRFSLSGSDRYYVLSAYSGAELAVRRAPPGALFRVMYDPRRQSGPLWSARRSHVVYVVAVNGLPVRTWDRVAAAARDDLAWAPWAGMALVVSGLGLLLWAARLQVLGWRGLVEPQK